VANAKILGLLWDIKLGCDFLVMLGRDKLFREKIGNTSCENEIANEVVLIVHWWVVET
jgi:hypothetical protein